MPRKNTRDVLWDAADRIMYEDLHRIAAQKRLERAAPDLLAALKLYVALDNDHRSGCTIEPDDWAECYQTATAAIAKAQEERTS